MNQISTNAFDSECTEDTRRLSSQPILPKRIESNNKPDEYDIYPYHRLKPSAIFKGYDSLSKWIADHKVLIIDGYAGVYWNLVKSSLDVEFKKQGTRVKWISTDNFFKTSSEIGELVSPFLGTPDSVWGTKTHLTIADFFIKGALANQEPDPDYDVTIAMGVGAALLQWDAPVLYLEIPKNELQYRMRAGSITNLGNEAVEAPGAMYKRFYFVDWVVLNQHKKEILNRISVIADVQWADHITWIYNKDLVAGLKEISRSVFRVRPWFEPGVWGGQWLRENIKGLNKAEINYAWSFEMIVPENGILFESDGNLLEVSFDFLMFHEHEAVLGIHSPIFKMEFPIRFDFLDTCDGGNLSIQCHPSLPYIRKEFGENITQDETYYILDSKEDAKVYLGFQEGINSSEFRKELESSRDNNHEIDIEHYVQTHKSNKHDLFLIPNGTVHSAGVNNLVLEISATPYIFTFKMYDWLRMDLNGESRAINIEHAFKNLDFKRNGNQAINELVSKPVVIGEGSDWKLIDLPTHPEHFYGVHRVEFTTSVTVDTNDVCHILMLVEGTSVTVQTENGTVKIFHYAETFVIPAAANQYTLINSGKEPLKVVKAFVKESLKAI